MKRNLTILGLATLAVLAASAIASAIGSADVEEKFTAASYPATLHSEPTTHTYTFAGGVKYECSTTLSGELTEASAKVHLNPSNTGCVMNIGGSKFPTTTTTFCAEGLDHYEMPNLTRTICKKGYLHIIKVYKDAGHTEKICEFEVTETDGETITHENLGGTSGVKLTWDIGSIAYKRVSGILCGAAEGEATYSGTSTVTAKNKEGAAISFDIG